MRGQEGPSGPDAGGPDGGRLLDVVLGLYRAAQEASPVTTMLALTAPLFGTQKAMYLRVDRMRPSDSISELVGVTPEFAALMKNRRVDEKNNIWRAVFAVPAGATFRTSDIIPLAELAARPNYGDVTVRGGLANAVSGVIENGPKFFSNITFLRAEDFSVAEMRLLEILLPHLQTAVQISQRITLADAGRRGALMSFDRVKQSVVLLDASGYAMYCSDYATRVLQNADGLELKFGRFLFENVTTQAEFERAVRVATASIGSDIPAAPYRIRVTRRSAGSPYALVIIPVHDNTQRALMPDGAACMILIHDLDRTEELPLERLAWLFRLTPAEVRICESLYRRGSIDLAAEDLHLTRNTVRSHLKSIYGKFGVATQGQLMQRLANSATLLRGNVAGRFGTTGTGGPESG